MKDDWKILEGVVAAIERSLHGSDAEVTRSAMVPTVGDPKVTREVDVLIEFPFGGRVYRTGIEVKDEERPLSLDAMDGLIGKLGDLDLQGKCVVAAAGFTEQAQIKATRNGVQCLDIKVINNPDWMRMSHVQSMHVTWKPTRTRLIFDQSIIEEVNERIAGANLADIEVNGPDGGSNIRQFAINKSLPTLNGFHPDQIKEGEKYGVTLNIKPPLSEGFLSLGDQKFPMPVAVDSIFVPHITRTEYPVFRFRRADGTVAVTSMASPEHQATFVDRGLAGDQRALSVTISPLSATRANVGPHPDRNGVVEKAPPKRGQLQR